jgi:ferredoxin, 2Fe-2S
MVPVVRVEPAGLEFEVEAGESVAEAAWRLGYAWPTVCWGQAECMMCFANVIDGEDQTEPAGDEELNQMQMLLPARSWTPHTRLACRLKLTGSGVVLEKRGVRPPRP